ncbi:MAG: sensor histidine kinase [Candidatus Kurthia intestinigallinarum]
MSIRIRLLLSYCALVVIPLLFTILIAITIALFYRGDVQELKSLYIPKEETAALTDEEHLILHFYKESHQHPENFLKASYVENANEQLAAYNLTLIVRHNENLKAVPNSLKSLQSDDLQPFGVERGIDSVEKLADGHYVTIKKIDFFFSDDSEGSLFFIQDAHGFTTIVRYFFPIILILLFSLLAVTTGLLTTYFSKSIVKPLHQLQQATTRIRDGNLSIPIAIQTKDEIGDLATSFEEMRQRLQKSIELQVYYENNRKELMANISHDLKTPITSIMGYVEGIRDGVANTPEKMDRYIQTIYTKSKNVNQMIDQLFLFSKLDLEKLSFHFENVDIRQYLIDIIESWQYELVDDLKLQLHICPGDYIASVDREQIQRVINNLIENTLKYNQATAKKMDIYLKSTTTQILMIFEDNGQGVALQDLPHLFEQFYRADAARTNVDGSGLGLSIVKQIIQKHGGQVTATNGEYGLRITITLERGLRL